MFKFQPFLAPAIAVACVACGASFTAHEGGNGAVAGSGNAGEASGGLTSAAGSTSVGEAGEVEAGGPSSAGQGSGGTSTSSGGTTTGTGGTVTGSGGRNWGNGGRNWGSNGGSTSADCATLEQEYKAAVEKARVCTKGSTDQCSASSVAQPVGGCGCPVAINAASEAGAEAKKAYQAYQDANCDNRGGALCDIACPPPVTASCTQQASGGGYVCTALTAVQN